MTDKPPCKLIGKDGNVFTIIGRVQNALNKVGQADKAIEFRMRAFSSESYDEVLRLCDEFVEIE